MSYKYGALPPSLLFLFFTRSSVLDRNTRNPHNVFLTTSFCQKRYVLSGYIRGTPRDIDHLLKGLYYTIAVVPSSLVLSHAEKL